ncbi:MAG: hypothetical protein QS721_02640 [Candidatus Endonucleobacter sp. (ex Gigantidas childressi)]|nr:hypothetical protein [Candidatus Endonucleobacter sp. (ex Gigantidas childressi)]
MIGINIDGQLAVSQSFINIKGVKNIKIGGAVGLMDPLLFQALR